MNKQEVIQKSNKQQRSRSKDHKQKKKKKKHHHDDRSQSQHKKKKKNYHRSRSYDETKKDQEKKKKKKHQRSNENKQKKKHKKKKSYSHSRSRSRDKHRQKDKKRDKYHDKKPSDRYRKDQRNKRDKFRFDSPPKSDESVMSDDSQKMQKLSQMKAAKQLVTSKADRKLYLGNLPPNITSNQLMEMLNSALKKMQINIDVDGDSIVSAWISPDGVGHYAFVQFRTAQQATNGLTLNGASLFGYQLKLGRPKQFIQYNKQLLSEMGQDKNLQTILKKAQTLGKEELPPIEQKIVVPPSKIIILKHIVSIEELGIDEQYNQILEDVTEMAKRFGDIASVFIPKPHETINLQLAPTRVKGLGLIFIQYKSVSQAMYARRQFLKKQFEGRPVACSYFDQKRFSQRDYDIMDKVIIQF